MQTYVRFNENIIIEIAKRTKSGVDKNDVAFAGYSKKYRQSDNFKIFKGGKRKPDLTLTGNMLASMKGSYNKNKKRSTIFFPDDFNNAKALNHTTGETVPQRDFLGLPKKVEEKLLREVVTQLERRESFGSISVADVLAAAQTLEVS